MNVLWTSAAASVATGGRTNRDWRATGVSIDSRTIQPGDLFIALKGPTHDGHEHVAKALAAGANAAMVSRVPGDVPAYAPLLVVNDTMEALQALGRAARTRTGATIIAVTGSAGKTGTKEALKLAFSRQGPTAASAESHNNHWGVPLSLARMPGETAFGVFEIGMNHPGEISPLSALVRPHVAIVTTVEAAHIEFFPSVEAVADAKAEIFDGMAKTGAAVLNRDNPHFARLAAAARAQGLRRILGFGAHPESWARLVDAAPDAAGTAIMADIGFTRVAYRVGIPGRHWVMNSLAVLTAVAAAGANVGAAAAALVALEPAPGRGRRFEADVGGGRVIVIDESYNANPASMRAAIDALAAQRPARGGRRIAVLGDMRELGPDSARYHAALAEPLDKAGVDLVFTAGGDMAHLHEALPASRRGAHAANSKALAPILAAALRPGDVLMVKGSHGSRMDLVIAALAARPAPALAAAG